jgi:NACHT domain
MDLRYVHHWEVNSVINPSKGNPGSGKTILASSIIDKLEEQEALKRNEHQICYFFFKYDSPIANTAAAAYKAILAQILWRSRHDKDLIDRFVFIMANKSEGQLAASPAVLLELLQLCLDSNSTLILDGIDEWYVHSESTPIVLKMKGIMGKYALRAPFIPFVIYFLTPKPSTARITTLSFARYSRSLLHALRAFYY